MTDDMPRAREQFIHYLDQFEAWVAQPAYSPDHPIGQHIMREAEADLQSRSQELVSNSSDQED
jgi:hypothetical protein